MQGGGGCWGATSCEENENAGLAGSSFERSDFDGRALVIGNAGIFHRSRADNPFRDTHQVYIPYCTGDFHAGTLDDVSVPGMSTPQQFAGAANMDIFLGMLAPLLSASEAVVLTGSSAGSLGDTLNYSKVAEASTPAPVSLLAVFACVLAGYGTHAVWPDVAGRMSGVCHSGGGRFRASVSVPGRPTP
ncbi:pectin acetylesterase-family hydrolase [Haliangium ochraceum]|uniref:pectin acetylesterase-family hydrolase n=1 Tax=Haliangium ochraceum TaxID=80816 RepID=UPI00019BA9CB|nr:pectin acetylesterase-family hydrolase [Haliangium ochraceum]